MVGQSLGELPERDECQSPWSQGGLPARGEEVGKLLVLEEIDNPSCYLMEYSIGHHGQKDFTLPAFGRDRVEATT